MDKQYWISASILSANLMQLGTEVDQVLAAGADRIHFDVMDYQYVPNLTFGPLLCQALRAYGVTAPIEVHLMVQAVDPLIIEFAQSGASHIIIHPEASQHLHRSLALIQAHGCQAGVALNPATPLNCLEYIFDQIDQVLVMSVNPGFAGQIFIPSSLAKIQAVKNLLARQNRPIDLAVDGGIGLANLAAVQQAGANGFIMGSAIFTAQDYATRLNDLRALLPAI